MIHLIKGTDINGTFLFILCLFLFSSCSKKHEPLPVPEYFNEGLAEGVNYGLAWNYLYDNGIGADDFVLAAENFESGIVTIPTQDDRYKKNVKVVTGGITNSAFCAEHTWEQDYNGPASYFIFPEKAHRNRQPAYFVRMYFNFGESFHPYYNVTPPATGDYKGVGVKGFGIYNESGASSVNIPCDGTNWYGVACQFVGWGPSVKPVANNKFLWVGHLYSYNAYPELAVATLGTKEISNPGVGDKPYRFSAYAEPFYYIKFGDWVCYEIGLYLNTPGKADGEARFWINGVLQSRTTNMRFRDLEEGVPHYVSLNLHRVTEKFPHTMIRYADNIVIANRYIGPVRTE